MTVLYITQNGITDHIGRSQVAPYVLGLARLGFSIHVLSAEKAGQERLIDQYQRVFDTANIQWTRVRYRNRPRILGQLWTQRALRRAAQHIVGNEGTRVIHSRSFPPALIAHRLKQQSGVKFIFDFRDFYADGGLEKTHGLARLAYRRLKDKEGPMIRNADKVVCLTQRAREVIAQWYLQDADDPGAHFQVIPCCADFDHFNPDAISMQTRGRLRDVLGLRADDFVLLYLGSLGPDYMLPQMMALFRQLMEVQQRPRFLFVSNNGRDLVERESAAQGIPRDYIRFLCADRDEVPALLTLADMSVFFIDKGSRPEACSPTKLAELFACNVPIIANGGVGDLDSIIDLPRNGSVLVNDFSDSTLRAAVEKVIACKAEKAVNIRDNSREFALEAGVARYAAVYQELLNN